MAYHNSRRSPAPFLSGGRGFHSPSGRGGGCFRPIGGGGEGFKPMGGGDGYGYGDYGFSSYQAPPLSGHKRGFRGGSPDCFDGGNFAKLFVGSVPRTATEEDIRPLFEEHGNVIEVALIKDKKTGQHQGCCFIKYATSEGADQAIRALHNQHTLPGGVGPIKVRYANGERERLGAVEYKLFVSSLNKQATVKDVEEIFSKYGRVEDVYLLSDEKKQSRGCGFVNYSHRDMALTAINALNGIYTMRGCEQPLIVRFADPKRPRQGDRDYRGTAFGGPRFEAAGPRPPSNTVDPMGDRMPPPNAWRPMHAPNMGPPSNAGFNGMGPPLHPRSGDMALPTNVGGPIIAMGGSMDDYFIGQSLPSVPQQNFNQPLLQIPPVNQQQIASFQKPIQSSQELPPSHQLYSQGPPYSQAPPLSTLRPLGQPQPSLSASSLPPQQLHGMSGQFPTSQPQTQQSALSPPISQVPLDASLKSNTALTTANQPLQQQVASVQQHPVQALQQSPPQLAQMLSQQTQNLQARFHSSQQAFSQLQQQIQMIQPTNQASTKQQNSEATNKLSQWAGTVPQAMASTPAAAPAADMHSSASGTSAVPVVSQDTALAKCNWTEHLSPEGFKYYYNSATGESQWEKPEELTSFEQKKQQKMLSVQQSQTQSYPSILSAQQLPQIQQVHPQHHLQGLVLHQQPSLSSPKFQAYEVAGHQNAQELGYKQIQPSAIAAGDPGGYSQGINTSQEWWKNKPAGV